MPIEPLKNPGNFGCACGLAILICVFVVVIDITGTAKFFNIVSTSVISLASFGFSVGTICWYSWLSKLVSVINFSWSKSVPQSLILVPFPASLWSHVHSSGGYPLSCHRSCPKSCSKSCLGVLPVLGGLLLFRQLVASPIRQDREVPSSPLAGKQVMLCHGQCACCSHHGGLSCYRPHPKDGGR